MVDRTGRTKRSVRTRFNLAYQYNGLASIVAVQSGGGAPATYGYPASGAGSVRPTP